MPSIASRDAHPSDVVVGAGDGRGSSRVSRSSCSSWCPGGGYLYANWRFDAIPKIHVSTITYPCRASRSTSSPLVRTRARDFPARSHAKPERAPIRSWSTQRRHQDHPRESRRPHDHHLVDTSRHRSDLARQPGALRQLQPHQRELRQRSGLLVSTIKANFGITINHVVQVNFSGLINSAVAIGVSTWTSATRSSTHSGLEIKHPGCQLINGFQALAVARSRTTTTR